MTTKENIKRLADNNRHIRYTYDEYTNRLRMYLTVPPSIVWEQWQQESDSLRKQATMRRSNVIPDLWTVDYSAPTLDNAPPSAIVYRPDIKAFLPMLNIANWKKLNFVTALGEAVYAASSATLYLERHGQVPDGDSIEYGGLIFAGNGNAHGKNAAMIANLVSRFNAS